MPKKLSVDGLSSEITAVRGLLTNAQNFGDIIGEIQFQHRLDELETQLAELKQEFSIDNSASVALFFGGQPVVGSKGIASEFAGLALEKFQNLIAKIFASNEVGELGERGRVPFKHNSQLMITGLARGSFGFVLDEMSDQPHLEESQLSQVVDKATHLLRDVAAQDEAVFESVLDDLEPRVLGALTDFFANLDSHHATIRVVEKELDFVLDHPAIHRAKSRTEATTIEEKTHRLEGVLEGFLPIHRKFELKADNGEVFYGSVSKEAISKLMSNSSNIIGKRCTVKVTVKTVTPLNRPHKEVINLIEFLSVSPDDNSL